MLSLHHLHVRKRIHRNLEQYPNVNKYKRWIDRLIYSVSFIIPVVTLPQVFSVWQEGGGEGISVLTWGFYSLSSAVWLLYGIVHKEKPLIFLNFSMVILNGLVALGALIY